MIVFKLRMIRPRFLAIRSSKVIGRTNQSTDALHSLNEIKQIIPNAVKRSPTSVLSALSSTVGKDSTAPHFQFIDDPAMIPSTLTTKRAYYMAKEMGKRAARQLATEWPSLFAFDRDQPLLEVFRPQGAPDPLQMEPSEENLVKLVNNRSVKDACVLYERMRSDGIDMSDHTKESLLALTAFYSNEDVPLSEIEEWHGLRNLALTHNKPWTSAGVADLVYESLPPSPLRKSVMICALCKHSSPSSIKRAKEIYEELLSSSATSIPSRAFAALVDVSSWQDVKSLLTRMAKLGVRADEKVWAAAVGAAAKISGHAERELALRSTIGEMIACGEKGSLRIFDSLLTGLYEEKEDMREAEKEVAIKKALSALVEVVEELEKRELIEVVSTRDSHFFCTAMNLAKRSGNLPIAQRIISLYESTRNEVKLMTLGNEGIFYSSYLMLCTTQLPSIDEVYKVYKSSVPRVVGVSKGLALNVFKRLEATGHWSLLHRLANDCISARMMVEGQVGAAMRNALISTPLESLSPSERDQFSSLVPRLVSLWIEFSRFTQPNQKRLQYKLSPFSISECGLLLSRVGEVEKAWDLLEMLNNEENTHGEDATIVAQGTVKGSAMNELLDDALRRGNGENAATCIQLIATTNVNKQRLEHMANAAIQRCGLSPIQARIISGFVRLRQD
ncbi:hypothetical protein PFISCL1PPCAC_20056 [Pristionchus fissidentatus]|uniref:Uncharacterized protein n=1 Tax=Pristionchus fissidentatus TaxID=1538716 RepID=A0AAV5W9U8_9BILA|nr:hypothetical protein PFISCL1PPCAC_20056 [Pristionchus fissidentatus]